jgi:hypothetical protein
MTRPLDFGRVKGEASFEQILLHYGVKVVGSGRQRMALCPFHPATKPSCSIHLERKVFSAGCGAKDRCSTSVALIENPSIARPQHGSKTSVGCGMTPSHHGLR